MKAVMIWVFILMSFSSWSQNQNNIVPIGVLGVNNYFVEFNSTSTNQYHLQSYGVLKPVLGLGKKNLCLNHQNGLFLHSFKQGLVYRL